MVAKLKVFFALSCLALLVGAWPSTGRFFIAGPRCLTNCVVTHLYDNNNSGWNQNETSLTVANVPTHLTLIASSTSLDEQVDAQPLVVDNWLYIVTENDTIYKINATTGVISASRHFGNPVPASVSGCDNNSSVIGITATPVIDPNTGILYLVAYTYPSNVPTYTIYGIDRLTLNNRITPQVISVTATLTDSTTYAFNATVSRNRSALKLGSANVYVAFSSFCDFHASTTRGWIMAFNKSTLALAVANGYLVDQVHPDTVDASPYFLSSIWSSGVGPAIDGNGNVYASTGNTGVTGSTSTYTQTTNLAESVVKFSPALAVSDYLSAFNVAGLDSLDLDVASGSVNLLPVSTGPHPHIVMATGKTGITWFVDTSNMGHYNGPSGPNLDVAEISGGAGCHCATAWFIGSDGILRVAKPNGGSVSTYKITTSPSFSTAHDKDLGGGNLPQGQDQGFFPTISSNGQTAGTDILWVITHPTGTEPNTIVPTLYAFDAINGTQLFSHVLNDWPNVQGDMNAVPVVSNGKVYAASFKSFFIFGLM